MESSVSCPCRVDPACSTPGAHSSTDFQLLQSCIRTLLREPGCCEWHARRPGLGETAQVGRVISRTARVPRLASPTADPVPQAPAKQQSAAKWSESFDAGVRSSQPSGRCPSRKSARGVARTDRSSGLSVRWSLRRSCSSRIWYAGWRESETAMTISKSRRPRPALCCPPDPGRMTAQALYFYKTRLCKYTPYS